MRKSRQREIILSVVRSTDCHPTADWVYHEARKQIPSISLGTVYRNLKVLSDSGEIRSYEGPGGVNRYDGTVETHYHFRCELCGAVIDLQESVDLDLDRRVSERTGLDIKYHVLEFRGVCVDCWQDKVQSGAHDSCA